MISFGKTQWRSELKSLWQDTFGDSDRYLAAFFAEQYRDENTLVYLEDNRPVAALYMIPYELQQGCEHYSMAYFYALATRPAYRGRGYMSLMIQEALRLCKVRGTALAGLIPADERLFSYYEKFGFEAGPAMRVLRFERSEIREENVNDPDQPSLQFFPATAAAFWEAYRLSPFYGPDAVRLSHAQNTFYMKTFLDEGGELLLFDSKERGLVDWEKREEQDSEPVAYVMFKLDRDDLHIIEANVEEQLWPRLARTLFRRFPEANSITLQQPLFRSAHEQCRPFAMVKKFVELDLSRTLANRFLQ